jgi:hypothetical protein
MVATHGLVAFERYEVTLERPDGGNLANRQSRYIELKKAGHKHRLSHTARRLVVETVQARARPLRNSKTWL